jgi:hypothetical protein
MNMNHASLLDAGVDDPDTLPISDFESLVAAGLLHGTRQEAAHFFSGWRAFEDHGRASPDSLRLIVLPGLAKDDG